MLQNRNTLQKLSYLGTYLLEVIPMTQEFDFEFDELDELDELDEVEGFEEEDQESEEVVAEDLETIEKEQKRKRANHRRFYGL
jgi:hypothetical protein